MTNILLYKARWRKSRAHDPGGSCFLGPDQGDSRQEVSNAASIHIGILYLMNDTYALFVQKSADSYAFLDTT